MNKYYLDEKKLLENWISKNYLPGIFNEQKNTEWQLGEGVQFIVRPQCNQQCKYCYITQHGDKLYPKETRVSNDILLKNIKMVLEWEIENKVFVPYYELFAGDLFGDKLYYQILDVFIEVHNSIKQQHMLNVQRWKRPLILMPTNGYFFRFKEHRDLIRQYSKKMFDNGLELGISWSTDGLYASDARENISNSNNMTQQNYDEIFEFVKEMHFGMHPMISSESIKNSIKNFDWWMEMYKKHQLNTISNGANSYPLGLEVRNYYWTDEEINEFVKLIRHIWDVKMKLNHDSTEEMAYHLFIGDGKNNTLRKPDNYDLTILHKASLIEEDDLSCNMACLFRINVADMSLPVCHRVTYKEFNGGHFEIKNDKIVGLIPSDGLSGYMQIKLLSPKFYPKCCVCDYRDFCIKGCLGSQYEYSGEILQPIPTVCKLEQAKINTLLELYNTYGIIDIAIKNQYISNDFVQVFIYLSKKIGVFNERRTDINT